MKQPNVWEAAQWTRSDRSGDVTSGQSEGLSVVLHYLIYSNIWSVHTLGEVQLQTTGGAKGMYWKVSKNNSQWHYSLECAGREEKL